MKSHEASSLYSDAPLFSFGFGVQFNVGVFLGQCMPRIFLICLPWNVLTVFFSCFYQGC